MRIFAEVQKIQAFYRFLCSLRLLLLLTALEDRNLLSLQSGHWEHVSMTMTMFK